MADIEVSVEDLALNYVSPIATPLIADKLLERSLKLIKKAAGEKKCVYRGVGEVTKALRKDEKGVVFLAADVFPVDIIAHLPALCEQKGIAYCFIPNRKVLGLAARSKRPASVLFIKAAKSGSEYESHFGKVHDSICEKNPFL